MNTIGNLAAVPPSEPNPQTPDEGAAHGTAQALIGWMKPPDAHALLASSDQAPAPQAQHFEMAARARTAVSARPDGVDQTDLVTPRPPELEAHVAALRSTPNGMQMFNEGWEVALVDLTRVCAFQPFVNSDQAIERVEGINCSDITALASLTLPPDVPNQLPVHFDQSRQAFIMKSPNMNLRVIGPIPPSPAQSGLGFVIGAGPSYLQVGRYSERFFLRDGYHRAYGLLRSGVSVVPAFVRTITAFEELLPDPRLMLPQDAYRGTRPPVLPDYLDDTVSASVLVPRMNKLIVIQALETAIPS